MTDRYRRFLQTVVDGIADVDACNDDECRRIANDHNDKMRTIVDTAAQEARKP